MTPTLEQLLTKQNRMLARICAILSENSEMSVEREDHNAEAMLAWASPRLLPGDERLALAEQQGETDTGRCPVCGRPDPYGVGCCTVESDQKGETVEPPRAEWIEEARNRARKVFADAYNFGNDPGEDDFEKGLDAFIAAMPQHDSVIASPSLGPQPDEVPEDIHDYVADIFWKPGRAADQLREIANHIWNAARRHSPMPAKVTDKFADDFIGHLRDIADWSFDSTAHADIRAALEAALSAAPKES